ncbi:MAG: 2Fe-2S iron-sulfur cluster-binding protein, partial [Candidatus Aminicenantes bacterium]|nr:2Fe-2S iron-sulfur cluster-binding protein [Candidatus Aminicenantes bacterium]
MAKTNLTLNVNGSLRQISAELDEPLLWVLRDDLGLTGTKFGCGSGECGTCSVLIDGEVYRSCRLPVAFAAMGQKITTIEGIGSVGNLSALQKAFVDHTAFGCGYCT